jgi:nicotinate-nucleotide adenylyltransferase
MANDKSASAGRLVVLGGTFDPVHHGHLIVARSVAEQIGESVTLMPARCPPHKPPPVAPAEHRLEMLRASVLNEPQLIVSEAELKRQAPCYTIDTVTALGDKRDISWIIGADMLVDLPRWHRAAELAGMVEFIVAAREPWHEELDQTVEAVRSKLGPRLRVRIATTPRIDIASSDIRSRAGRGLSIRYLVPEAVESYIREHRLYTGAEAT